MENTWIRETFLPAWNQGNLPSSSLSASFILLSQSSLMFDRKRKSGKWYRYSNPCIRRFMWIIHELFALCLLLKIFLEINILMIWSQRNKESTKTNNTYLWFRYPYALANRYLLKIMVSTALYLTYHISNGNLINACIIYIEIQLILQYLYMTYQFSNIFFRFTVSFKDEIFLIL